MHFALRQSLAVGVCLTAVLSAFAVPRIAAAADARCTLRDVVVYTNRIHCQCTTTTTDGSSVIRYFAVPTTDAKLADRLLTIGTTALVSGRRFIAGYNSGDVSGNAFGCKANDCRKLMYFGME
jgi:hypothetical protein